MQRIISYRVLNILLVIASLVGMGFAFFYLQKYLQLEPCPLCIFQRIGLMTMGAFALIAAGLNPKSMILRLILWLGTVLGIGWALFVAARHVWLQHLPPDKVPSCGPGLDYLVEALPKSQVITQVLSGSGECSEVSWRLLGLSIPEQSLIFFSILMLITLLILWRIIKDHNHRRSIDNYKNTIIR